MLWYFYNNTEIENLLWFREHIVIYGNYWTPTMSVRSLEIHTIFIYHTLSKWINSADAQKAILV